MMRMIGFKKDKDALKSYEDALNGDEKVFKCNKKGLNSFKTALSEHTCFCGQDI